MDLNRRNLLAGGVAAGVAVAAGGASEEARAAASSGGKGRVRTICLEAHCMPKELAGDWGLQGNAPAGPTQSASIANAGGTLNTRLQDFDGQRLEDMDRAGIEFAVLSHSVYGPQGQFDPARAHDLMIRGNDALAQSVSRHPDRYGGFGCLSMHDVDAACREFERAVRKLGFLGVMLNNWQRAGANGELALTYDDRRFDPFWDMAQKLDVPVYLHPGWSPPWYSAPVAGLAAQINGAAWNWAVEVGTHALRIITSGVFDRFPKAQMILGHNGEHIVTDLWRIENRLHGGWARLNKSVKAVPSGDRALPYSALVPVGGGYGAQKTLSEYFRTNVTITTSGEFNDAGLQHVINAIGADRVMFSTDYPYEDMIEAGDWFQAMSLKAEERRAIARGNQIRLLKPPVKA